MERRYKIMQGASNSSEYEGNLSLEEAKEKEEFLYKEYPNEEWWIAVDDFDYTKYSHQDNKHSISDGVDGWEDMFSR